jgi:hypothetical protein
MTPAVPIVPDSVLVGPLVPPPRRAGVGWRVLAAAVDVAVLLVLVFGVAGLASNNPWRMLNQLFGDPARVAGEVAGLFTAFWLGTRGGYYVFLFYVPAVYALLDLLPWGTVGKLAVGLRLVRRRDGLAADVWRRLLRTGLVYAPLWFGAWTALASDTGQRDSSPLAAAVHCGLGVLCAVSFLWAAAPGRRALHDRAAGTYLTRDRPGQLTAGFAPVLPVAP